MDRREDTDEDNGGPSRRRVVLMAGTGALVVALMIAGVVAMLSGDKDPPRKVHELTIVAIVPPPPPPPPPPEKQPEQKMVEQTPVKQEIIEEKPVDIPKDAPPDAKDDPMPGPPGLDDAGKGPGDLLGRPGGRGFIGGGGGGGGGSSRWGWYASIVQAQIEAALRANEKTRHAVMRIQVRLWSDATGRINRVQLVSSSGNSDLDAVIRDQILSGLTLREPPPKDMPMPIITRVTAQSPT
jgi:outer membrane biosynthesis protein TonB